MIGRIRTASTWRLAVLAGFAGLGTWLGSLIGSGWGSTGLALFVNAAVALVLAILVLAVLIVIAALVVWKRTDRVAATMPFLRVGAIFLGGIAVGWGLSVAFRPPPQVVLTGTGTMRLSSSGLNGYAAANEPATCQSEVNSTKLALVETNTVGTIGPDFVTASVSMFPADPGRQLEVRISLRPAVKGPVEAPGWLGTGEVVVGVVGDAHGQIAFTDLVLLGDQAGVQPPGWPTSLSGTIDWSCIPVESAQASGARGLPART